jgi:multisubunit Na+/H+ antiporter MnhC subunit
MERVNSRLGKHLWLQVVLSALVAGAVVWLLFPERSLASVLTRVAVASLGGVVVLLVVRRKEKRAAGGSADDLVSLDRMLRRGEVPTDPQARQAMRELVDQRLHRTRHRVAAQLVLAVMWTTLVILMALTAGLGQTLGMTVFAGAFLTWLVLYGNLQHRRLHTMREALHTRN